MTEYNKEVGNATNAYPICNKNALFAISYYKMQAYYVKLCVYKFTKYSDMLQILYVKNTKKLSTKVLGVGLHL